MSPEISVIVPVYNTEKYIEKCARSLFSQTFNSIEFCFVDDCSEDNSIAVVRDVLEVFPNRKSSCKFIKNETNMGIASSRNKGLDVAEGKYIYFCDSDDCLDETMLEKMYQKAESSSADVVFSDFYFSYPDTEKYYSATNWSEDKVASLKSYIISHWTVIWNMLVERDIYERNKIKYIDGCNFCEDFNVAVKVLFVAGKVANISEALYHYNQLKSRADRLF